MNNEQYPQTLPPQIQLAPYGLQQQINQQSLIELTNPERDLYELELSLRGKRLDEKNEPVNFGEPLLNEKGVASILRAAKSMVSQVSIMSNYEEQDVRTLVIYLGKTIIRDLMFNKDVYEIKNNTARHAIVQITCTQAFAAGMRAMENGERRLLRGTQQEQTIITKNEAGKKQGLMDAIKSGLK